MFAAKNKIFPLEIHPPVLHIVEGKSSDYQREDRKVETLNIQRHEVTVQYSFKDGKGLDLKRFYEKAEEAGIGMGTQMSKMRFAAIEEAVKETGNEVKVKKGGLTQDHMLQLLEMGQQNFDEHGNPTSQFVCGSEFMEELRKHEQEWNEDKEFQAKVEEIKSRKKAEFNEREARRRLVS